MLTQFDDAVIAYSDESGISTDLIYHKIELHLDYKGYRDRHTTAELLEILEKVKSENK